MEDFNFWIPIDIDIQKSGKGKPKMRIKGIASTADTDTDEEVLEPEGFVLDRLVKSGYFNYDHRSRENPMYIVGEPDVAKVVDGKLYVEGNLYDTPLARDIWEFANVLKKSGSKRGLGMSIEGKALTRDPFNQKRITKALLTGIAITPAPKNVNTIVDVVKGGAGFIDYEFDTIKTDIGDIIIEKSENGFIYSIDNDLKVSKRLIVNPEDSLKILIKALGDNRLNCEQIKMFRNVINKIAGK